MSSVVDADAAVESNIRENELINAQLSADAAWDRVQQLSARNEQLTSEVANYRQQSMRQYYGMQGFMAIKNIVDRYNRHIDQNTPDDTIGRIYATILEHKTNMDRADAK